MWALLSRDAQTTELAIKIDRLERQVDVLSSALVSVKADATRLADRVAEHVADEATTMRRFGDVMERDSRMRLERAESTLNLARDVKARLDRIEAKNGGNYHGYATFEAVSIRLTELGEVDQRLAMLMRQVKWAVGALAGFAIALVVVALRFGG